MWTKRLTAVCLGSVLAFAACHKRAPAVALPPSPATPPAPVAALDEADRAFTAGNYAEAARAYDSYLRMSPAGGQRDQALFRLGLTYALRSTPAPDWQRAGMLLKQVLDEFPNSPWRSPASLILSLRSELDQLNADSKLRDQRIKQLGGELDRLKKIDAERRKRP